MMKSLPFLSRRARRSTLEAPSSLRVEVCPPSLRQAPDRTWQRAMFWLLGRPSPEAAAVALPSAAASTAPFTFSAFAVAFMKQYWFHFELATVLLLVGIVAAWTAIKESR